jgi:hypothetical protein
MRRRPDLRARYGLAEQLGLLNPDELLALPHHVLVGWYAHYTLKADELEQRRSEER